MPSIHGDKVILRILENGAVQALVTATDFSAQEQAQDEDLYFVGNPIPEMRKKIMGWAGRWTLTVIGPQLDLLIQRFNDAVDAGVNIPEITIVVIEKYDSSDNQPTTVSTYSGCQITYDEHRTGGKQDLVQKSFSFRARTKRVETL